MTEHTAVRCKICARSRQDDGLVVYIAGAKCCWANNLDRKSVVCSCKMRSEERSGTHEMQAEMQVCKQRDSQQRGWDGGAEVARRSIWESAVEWVVKY